MAQYPLINGHRYSFSSLEANIAGIPVPGISELSYNDGLEPGAIEGTSPQRLGRTRGKYESDGSMSMYRQEFDELTARLGDGYGERSFNIVASYADDGQPTVTDRLVGCRIKKVDNQAQKGSDPLEVKLELDIMYIERNGKTLVKNLRR